MFERLISLIGIERFTKVQKNRVLLLGVGGVGGYVAEMLIRSGIRNLTIVDKDTVDVTNLNRQIIALTSTIGEYKVDVLKKRLEDITPDVEITPIKKQVTEEDIGNLDLKSFDYVVDCIDDLKVKVALAKYSLDEGIHLIISTGTARKLHPEKLEMTVLSKTSYDPLARAMRNSLKGYDTSKLRVLASTERPIPIENGTLGSSAFVPSTAGILIASHIINEIIEGD